MWYWRIELYEQLSSLYMDRWEVAALTFFEKIIHHLNGETESKHMTGL